jgi:hypothetical protein
VIDYNQVFREVLRGLSLDESDPDNVSDAVIKFDIHNRINEAYKQIVQEFPTKALMPASVGETKKYATQVALDNEYLRILGLYVDKDDEGRFISIDIDDGVNFDMDNLNLKSADYPVGRLEGTTLYFTSDSPQFMGKTLRVKGVIRKDYLSNEKFPLEDIMRMPLVSLAIAKAGMVAGVELEIAQIKYQEYDRALKNALGVKV